MKQGIKAEDIHDFEKSVERLNEIINRIRQYKLDAYIYVTPSQINLISEPNDEEYVDQNLVVTSKSILHLDCGDW